MGTIDGALEFRRALHRAAELSGSEERTSALVREHLRDLAPDRLVENIGGHGLAAVYNGRSDGPRVLIRCELDALPIPEPESEENPSETPGVSHRCGHDGHMAIVAGLAALLHESPLDRGAAILLFQPAEETGAGARRVLEDPAFAALGADMAFALHNVPGWPEGSVLLRDGVFASTARSLRVELTGKTAHAAEPSRGLSPAGALSELLGVWPAVPHATTSIDEAALVTVVHARLGEPALGTSPGVATAIATLRAQDDDVMGRLSERCEALARGLAAAHGLSVETEWLEEFPCTQSSPDANALVEQAAREQGLQVVRLKRPFAWTEDFGHLTASLGGAMFGLGAGEDTAPLHHPDYVFPERLVPVGSRLFRSIVELAAG